MIVANWLKLKQLLEISFNEIIVKKTVNTHNYRNDSLSMQDQP